MEDIKEIDGMNIQPKTSKQPKISMMLLLALQFYNLGRLRPQNPISSLGKRISTQWSLETSDP